MKNLKTALLTLSILLVAICANAAADRLVELAKSSGKPVIADFGKGGTCPLCQDQKKELAKVQPDCEDNIHFEYVHVIKEAPLMGKYRIFLVPTMIFIDTQGNEAYRSTGVMNAKALRDKIEELGWAEF